MTELMYHWRFLGYPFSKPAIVVPGMVFTLNKPKKTSDVVNSDYWIIKKIGEAHALSIMVLEDNTLEIQMQEFNIAGFRGLSLSAGRWNRVTGKISADRVKELVPGVSFRSGLFWQLIFSAK